MRILYLRMKVFQGRRFLKDENFSRMKMLDQELKNFLRCFDDNKCCQDDYN